MSTELTSNEQKKQVTSVQTVSEQNINIKRCENCHAEVHGMYCSQCGQSVESTLKYFWTVLLHILDDIFSFDSRANRTLVPLLLKPGFLTQEYIAGRRVHYVPPLRLYLFISIIFFISLKYFIHTDDGDIFSAPPDRENIVSQIDEKLLKIDQELITTANENKATLSEQQVLLKQFRADIKQKDNPILSKLSTELAQLELKENKYGEPWQKAKYDKIKRQLENVRTTGMVADPSAKPVANTDTAKEQGKINIGNNNDGSFTLSFLSETNNKVLSEKVQLIEDKANQAVQSDPKKLIETAISKMPQIMFVLLPLFAVLLKIMFIFSKRLYLEHLTVALHSHSFIFFSVFLVEIAGFASDLLHEKAYLTTADIMDAVQVCLLIWIPIYLFLMQKRVYKQGVFFTTIKYIFIGSIYTMMIALSAVIAFVWGVVEL